MYDLPIKSAATYMINPAHIATDFSDLPLSYLRDEMVKAQKQPLNTELALLKFYFYNHVGSLIEQEFGGLRDLPKDLAGLLERRQKETNLVAKQMFFQVIASTHGHLFTSYGGNWYKPNFWEFFETNYGKPMKDFFKSQPNSYQFHNWVGRFPDVTCGEFLKGTHATFVFCGSGSAKAWAGISRLGADIVTGHISLEGLADQAFSICHNGGSILNKGHFFSVCTSTMYKMLDVQDSGQIPHWILEQKGIDKLLMQDALLAANYFPELKTPVNNKLINNSEAKRNAYTKNLQQIAMAAGGLMNINQGAAPPPNPEQELNGILLGAPLGGSPIPKKLKK